MSDIKCREEMQEILQEMKAIAEETLRVLKDLPPERTKNE